MPLLEKHRSDVAAMSQEFAEWNRERLSAALPGNMTLAQTHVSNTMRSNAYKERGPKIEIGHLNRVLRVDADRKIALVEPCVTMEQLVDATLPYHLVPAVVTEFKTITVGGAINGGALESSSHRYAQFNDTCERYEVLLGDGSVVYASPHENSDLFYGMSGSYGTLGIVLLAEVRLVPASPWVVLNYRKYDSVDKAIASMKELGAAHYLEGIVYRENCTLVIEGNDADFHDNLPKISLKSASSPWFYDHVKSQMERGVTLEAISLRDYLFRHDRGAFWMGAYGLYPKLIIRYLLEYCSSCPEWLDRFLMKNISIDTKQLKSPSWIFRRLFGWLMDSGRLYGFMHNQTEQWFADHFAIQDYYIPEDHVVDFIQYVLNEHQMAPIWLCPLQSTTTPQCLSPHYFSQPGLLFDVGVYAISRKAGGGREVVQDLDKRCVDMGGKKMLYAYSYATPEKFWTNYSKESYDALRAKYLACDVFPEITKKVLS